MMMAAMPEPASKPFNSRLGVIADAQDEQERDQVNEERDDLPEKMRDHGRAPLFSQ